MAIIRPFMPHELTGYSQKRFRVLFVFNWVTLHALGSPSEWNIASQGNESACYAFKKQETAARRY